MRPFLPSQQGPSSLGGDRSGLDEAVGVLVVAGAVEEEGGACGVWEAR